MFVPAERAAEKAKQRATFFSHAGYLINRGKEQPTHPRTRATRKNKYCMSTLDQQSFSGFSGCSNDSSSPNLVNSKQRESVSIPRGGSVYRNLTRRRTQKTIVRTIHLRSLSAPRCYNTVYRASLRGEPASFPRQGKAEPTYCCCRSDFYNPTKTSARASLLQQYMAHHTRPA